MWLKSSGGWAKGASGPPTFFFFNLLLLLLLLFARHHRGRACMRTTPTCIKYKCWKKFRPPPPPPHQLFQNWPTHFQNRSAAPVEEPVIEKTLHANECVRWIEAFIANLSHPLWGSQSIQELAFGMRKVLPFLIYAKSSINCEPHKGCPRFAINASIHLTHSFAFSAFSMTGSSTTRFENLIFFFFLRMHKSKQM